MAMNGVLSKHDIRRILGTSVLTMFSLARYLQFLGKVARMTLTGQKGQLAFESAF